MIVVDTTVLVYAKGSDHALREPCRELITAIAAGDVEATTTPEVIQEFVHVRARRRGREDAVALGKGFADLLSPLLIVERADLELGLSIFSTATALGAFDAVLAAAAIEAGARALVSADRSFEEIDGLLSAFPDRDGIDRVLGA